MPRQYSKTRYSKNKIYPALLTAVLAIVWAPSVQAQGTVRAWGYNFDGQLGNGANADSTTPVPVNGLTGVAAVAGGFHSLALKSDGTVSAWGPNESGQLGNGTDISSNTPVSVSGLTGVVAIAGGYSHSLALRNDGTVRAWGFNGSGQLGNGTNTDSNTPVTVSNLTGVIAIAAGGDHSLALKGDGTVWAWGDNGDGELGNGANISSNVPVLVSTLTGVVAVASGFFHSLALKNDGTVWAWGYNFDGELGNGANTSSNTPVVVSNLTGVAGIAGGLYHSLARRSDGTVQAWGGNGVGQLGNGTSASSNIPVTVSNLTGVTAIAAGGEHSLALRSDGTVRAWGDNGVGQLGTGSTMNSSTPVQVSNLVNVSAISGGFTHSLAMVVTGPVCTYSISPASQSFAGGGGTGTVSVTAPPGCAWVATSNNSWIIITSGSSGSGNGTVGYTVLSNSASGRTGTITIAGQTFTIMQAGTGNSAPSAVSVSPSSGSGYTQSFNFVFSDLDGFADLVTTQVIFNSVLNASYGCVISFSRAGNSASLLNDTATSSTRLTVGAAGTAANGQCTIDVSQAAFVGSGATLAVNNVSITFAQGFAGTKNIYLYAQDAGGLNSGLPQLGTWTVPAFVNVAPSAVSVSPAAGVGAVQTFTLTFSDPNGYTDLVSPEIIINSSLDARSACAVIFNRRGNSMSLLNDGATGSAGVGLGGTLDITQNSQCVLYASGSSASGNGSTLTLNVALAFKAAFAGAKTVYLVTSDTAGATSGIQTRGTWTVPGSPPQAPSAGSVTPSSGTGQGGTFTYTFTDPNGFADLILPEIIFNLFRDGRAACVVLYDRFSNRFFLVNDSSTNSSSVAAGAAETTENGQCLVNGAGSFASGSGNTLTITLNVVFKQPFTGAKNIFLFAQGVEGLNTGLPQVGSWTVPPYTNQPPANVSVTPASGSGSGQLFQLRFRDPNGYGDLVAPEFLMNSVADSRNSCTVIYDKLNGAVLLVNDTATTSTPVLLNSAQTAQNSQCILLGQGSLVSAANTDLVLQLNLLFKPAFAGPKTIYMYTTDGSSAATPLEAKGTFTVQ